MNYLQLGTVFEEVVENQKGLSETNDITFIADLPAEMCARADLEQLHRTITNLVRNARQAIEAPTKTGAITLKADENDTQWIIDVIDTGAGLPGQVSGHLFQAFQGRSRAGGVGLGPAIS